MLTLILCLVTFVIAFNMGKSVGVAETMQRMEHLLEQLKEIDKLFNDLWRREL